MTKLSSPLHGIGPCKPGERASCTGALDESVSEGGHAPVIRDVEGCRKIEMMCWGFPIEIAVRRGRETKWSEKRVTTARYPTKHLWKPFLTDRRQRCIVPFSRFAEPAQGRNPVTRHRNATWFGVQDQSEPVFAGLWQSTANGAVFAILTCDPNSLVSDTHKKSMPVILSAADIDRWLEAPWQEALSLQRAYPAELMTALVRV